MNKNKKRLIAILLSVLLVFGVFSFAYANEATQGVADTSYTESTEEVKEEEVTQPEVTIDPVENEEEKSEEFVATENEGLENNAPGLEPEEAIDVDQNGATGEEEPIVGYAAGDEHLVTFDPDDGTPYGSWYTVTVPEGGLVTSQPADPEQEGYIFVGWYRSLDANGDPIFWDFATDTVTENTTLWAAWEAGHIVTFDPDDGTPYSTWFKTTVPDGGLVTSQPADPEQEGYIFVGWYKSLDANGDPVFWDFATDTVTENTTLWAAWEVGHIVTFDPDDGTPYPTWFKTTVPDGGLVTSRPADPQRAGYIFAGWYYSLDANGDPVFWDFASHTVTENTTLWAAWKEAYIVTFDPDNGTPYETWFKTTVAAGELVTNRPADPKLDGYVFVGWYKSLDVNGDPVFWDFATDTVIGNTTLWAAWVEAPIVRLTYTVRFDSQGGSAVNAVTGIEEGSTITTPPQPTREGYVFTGWFRDENATQKWNFATDEVNSNFTLYAGWTPVGSENNENSENNGAKENNEANTTSTVKPPKTGDSAWDTGLYILLAVAAGAGVVTLLARKLKKEKQNG